MDGTALTQSPFAVVTFIVAPALLTNASSVLAMSTINRMLRTRDRMSELYAQSESPATSEEEAQRIIVQVNRAEQQALLLLGALRSIYVALGAFAAATLDTLLAAVAEQIHLGSWGRPLTFIGIILGIVGVSGLIFGTIHLFKATRLSLMNIREEAAIIRTRHSQRMKASGR